MCDLSLGIWEQAMAEGVAKGKAEGVAKGRAEGLVEGEARGIAKGEAKGKAEGRAEATLSYLKTMMATLGLTLEQAMAALKIPEADRPQYTKQLSAQ